MLACQLGGAAPWWANALIACQGWNVPPWEVFGGWKIRWYLRWLELRKWQDKFKDG